MRAQIAPTGTTDPTPMIYDSTMHTMSGVLVAALIFNAMMRPVHPKHYTTTPEFEEEPAMVVDTTLTEEKN